MKFIIPFFAFFASSAFAATDYACAGTEPFWDLSLTDAQAKFEDPGNTNSVTAKNPTYKSAGATAAIVFNADQVAGFIVPTSDSIIVDKKGDAPKDPDQYRAYCSDGMSDKLYPYAVTVTVKGQAYYGCCERKENPALGQD